MSSLTVLSSIKDELEDCTRCKLHEGRTNIVFGEGSSEAKIIFVGEGPGYNEDQKGRPFIGQAGQLLDKMIKAMGYERNEVYITNVVKCRPPDNRVPERDEVATCSPFMLREIQAINPRIIVLLGLSAAKTVFNEPRMKLSDVRGQIRQWHPQPHEEFSIPAMITYHPAALLRNETLKAPTWVDLQTVMQFVGEKNE